MVETQESPYFNMAFATLERINNLLVKLSEFNLNSNIAGSRNTILELFKEVYIFMDKEQKKESFNKWLPIESAFIKWDDNRLNYDPKVYFLIRDFDFYLRVMLHTKGLIMPNLNKMKGLDKLKKSYNI